MAASRLHHLLLFLSLSAASLRPLAATSQLRDACDQTEHPEFCVSALSAKPESRHADLPGLAALSLSLAAESSAKAVSFVKKLATMPGGTPERCLDDCIGNFQAAVAQLNKSKAALKDKEFVDVQTWVSAAMDDAKTCMEGCQMVEGGANPDIADKSDHLSKLCAITLALANATSSTHTP